jgi:glycosyltransferase involved in cell wall biosynthesis
LSTTACLIVRNEASVLERCLRSISTFADELCVVDSGSDDATVNIARRFGARIKIDRSLADHSGRMRDFAAARNAVLAMARGSWMLSIDADEVLDIAHPGTLRWLLANERLHAIELRILSGGMRWYLPRLVRRMPWTRWHERVHEWVEIRGPTQRTDAATINNLPGKTGKESAAARDLRLCRQQLCENPNNLRAVFYMARALRHMGLHKKAIHYYERYWRESDFKAGRYAAATGAAISSLLLHDFQAARRFAMRAYRSDPELAEACCVLGDARLGLGRLELARRWFERAMTKRMPGRSYPLFVDQSSYDGFPRARLQWIRDQSSRARNAA